MKESYGYLFFVDGENIIVEAKNIGNAMDIMDSFGYKNYALNDHKSIKLILTKQKNENNANILINIQNIMLWKDTTKQTIIAENMKVKQ